MGDLIPLLGDGLLTIDGDYHRRARRIMLPAFHRERIAAADDTMVEETLARAAPAGTPAQALDVYHWARRLALRVAMRALFGLDPDARGQGDVDAAAEFERALRYYGPTTSLQVAARPAHAVAAHAGGARGARPHHLRGDRPPPPTAGARARTSSRC